MKVALNATTLLSSLTGIGQYTRHLAAELSAIPDTELQLFYGSSWSGVLHNETPRRDSQFIAIAKHRFFPLARPIARAYQQYRFNERTRRGDIDVYHEPNYLALKFKGPSVVTVHDLSWIRFPETHPEDRLRAMNRYLKPALRRAKLILTDSVFVKDEVINEFGLDPATVLPIPLGVGPAFHPRSADETRALLDVHGLRHGRYLLALGTLEPRKNLVTCLKSYMQLPPAMRQEFPLVLIGTTGWKMAELEEQLEPLRRDGHVRQLGYLPREDLPLAIAGARALVYPSIYEGFGLPPLEAMACGVPVIASNVSSIPEVVGDAGILLDPADVDGFSQAMQDVINDQALVDSLSAKSLERSRQFTWRKCALETRYAYELAISMAKG